MPPGVNFLFRLGRKLLAEPVEDTGWLPGKYYRLQALRSLEDNDFPECLRYLRMAFPHRKAQARMVAQLLVLRCRMLQADHERQLQSLKAMQRLEGESVIGQRYGQIISEEHKALNLLGRYIQEAQELMKKPDPPPLPSDGEINTA